MEVDAPRRDERRLHRPGAHRQRQRRHRDPVRIVRVHDVRLQALQNAREAPRGVEIELGPRRQRDQVQSFRRPLPQLSVRVRDQQRPMTEGPQAQDGHQHLILTATPRSRRVDVEGEHYSGESGLETRPSSASGRP
jgi:hypothetical protein